DNHECDHYQQQQQQQPSPRQQQQQTQISQVPLGERYPDGGGGYDPPAQHQHQYHHQETHHYGHHNQALHTQHLQQENTKALMTPGSFPTSGSHCQAPGNSN
ncbi:hypothetical protein Vretifemale_12970, partial [Volvox reticuliferus]